MEGPISKCIRRSRRQESAGPVGAIGRRNPSALRLRGLALSARSLALASLFAAVAGALVSGSAGAGVRGARARR
jgi:hypothetical protein